MVLGLACGQLACQTRRVIVEAPPVVGASSPSCFDDQLAAAAERGYVGLQLVVDRPGVERCERAAGLASIDAGGEPMTLGHAVHWASVTKQVTAAAVLRLVDGGRLDLDATVPEVVERADVAALPNIGEITVRSLLDHRSGLYAPNNDPEYIAALVGADALSLPSWTAERFLELVARRDPAGPPGSGAYYSDTNYILLGLIVEAVVGEPLSAHVRSTIFAPLDMASTYYLSALEPVAEPPVRTARGYLRVNEELLSLIEVGRFREVSNGVLDTTSAGERIPGAAAIVGTAGDLYRFADAYFRGDLLTFESRRLVASVADGLEGEPIGTTRQGVVVATMHGFGTLLTAEGDGPGGTNSVVAFHPASDTLVVALINQFGSFDESDFVIDEVVAEAVGSAAHSAD